MSEIAMLWSFYKISYPSDIKIGSQPLAKGWDLQEKPIRLLLSKAYLERNGLTTALLQSLDGAVTLHGKSSHV